MDNLPDNPAPESIHVSGNQQGNNNVQQNLGQVTDSTIIGVVEHLHVELSAEEIGSLIYRPGGTSAILAQNPDDLPHRPRQLFGRDDLLREVTALLDKGEQVLLQGFGGMGKTALAATAAGEWIMAGKGAVLWLKTGSASADALFESLAYPFNAGQDIAGQQGDAKAVTMKRLLRDKNVKLLVLDDCWNGQALLTIVKNAVPDSVAVLATARLRFSLDSIVDVDELKLDNALNLLLYHSKGKASDDARSLCKALGYHAFSIEIAGKTLKARQWTSAELLEKIKVAPHDLKTPADLSEEGRSSVKELLDTSLSILSDQEKAVFLAFGVFFAPQLTAKMLSNYMEKAVDTELLTLQDDGLVERIPATTEAIEHYRIHDLAYSYTKAQATKDQRRKALNECVSYIRIHKTDFDVLLGSWYTIMGAAQAAAEVDRPEALPVIMRVLADDGGYIETHGASPAVIELMNAAISFSESKELLETADFLLGKLGNIYALYRGELENGLNAYQKALKLAETRHDTDRQALLLYMIGYVRSQQKDENNNGETDLNRAYEIAVANRNEYVQAKVLTARGYYYAMNKKDYATAKGFYTQLLELAKRTQNKDLLYNAYQNMGSVECASLSFDDAMSYFDQSLNHAKKCKNRIWEGSAFEGKGEVENARGNRDQAQIYFDTAATIFYETDTIEYLEEVVGIMKENNYSIQSRFLAKLGEIKP